MKLPPWGLFGGGEGATTAYVRVRKDREMALKTKHAYELAADDVLSVRTSGGGGLGDPLARAPKAVAVDVALGTVSARRARAVYGVALDRRGGVDRAATAALRKELRAKGGRVARKKPRSGRKKARA